MKKTRTQDELLDYGVRAKKDIDGNWHIFHCGEELLVAMKSFGFESKKEAIKAFNQECLEGGWAWIFNA